jgi:hypothetical protein
MRSILRSFAFGLAGTFALGAAAQQPYMWVIDGQVANCYPGQLVNVQTIQGTQPPANFDVPVDSATCSYQAVLYLSSQWSMVQLSTMCNGAITYAYDSTSFNFFNDTNFTTVNISCGGGGGAVDCNGVLNGPDMPGTACNDGNPLTTNDTWNQNCVCTGSFLQNCQASFSVGQGAPWVMTTTNTSSGQGSLTYQWWMPDGSSSTAFEPVYTFPTSGVFGICLTISDSLGCSSTYCDSIAVDSMGMINNGPIWYDCLGVLWGNNMPGTSCDDGDPNTMNDTWSPMCICAGNGGGQVDCLGVPGGNALPGTVCTDTLNGAIFTGLWTGNCVCQDTINFFQDCLGIPFGPNMPGTACNDGDSLTVQDTWNANCVCAGVVLNAYDCNGVLNGPDMPGTPCDDGDPLTSNDMWDGNCDCVGSSNSPCVADFWVLQGFTVDSLNNPQPIPNELWIWNLSSGGSGTYTFLWSFGDGTSSTDPFPTHTYANGGPYVLCLTIDDGQGCTSTHCDSVSVDSNGMYTGFTGGGNQRLQGFTISVQNQLGTGVAEPTISEGLAIWPNPATNELNIALSDAVSGKVEVALMDANGRVMLMERHSVVSGRNQLLLNTADLAPGLYLLRISNGTQVLSQRIVKGN